MLIGIVTGRRIIGVPALVAAELELLIATVGPAIQQILVGERRRAPDAHGRGPSG